MPRDLAAHHEEKEALSNAYRTEMETVRQDPSAIAAAPPQEVARLKTVLGAFHRLLEDHRRALNTAKTVTERLVKHIADELAGDDRPTRRAVSLALDQVI